MLRPISKFRPLIGFIPGTTTQSLVIEASGGMIAGGIHLFIAVRDVMAAGGVIAGGVGGYLRLIDFIPSSGGIGGGLSNTLRMVEGVAIGGVVAGGLGETVRSVDFGPSAGGVSGGSVLWNQIVDCLTKGGMIGGGTHDYSIAIIISQYNSLRFRGEFIGGATISLPETGVSSHHIGKGKFKPLSNPCDSVDEVDFDPNLN